MSDVGALTAFSVAAGLLAAGLTWCVRAYALNRNLLDEVTDRSSHTVATPRGGGLAIIAAFLLCWSGAAMWFGIPSTDIIGVAGATVLVGVIGWIDDQSHVEARWRLLVHFACGAWLVAWLGLPALSALAHVPDVVWIAIGALMVFATAWSINLFNFMDGIDGIAAGEAAFIGLAAALLGFRSGGDIAGISAGIIIAAAACGFLVWNWPPAKIFMGDASSGFLGLAVAILALLAGRAGEAQLAGMIILPALFVVDASITLLRRIIDGARLSEAHRSHVYQRLARRGGSHGRVTTGFLLTNMAFVFPLALATAEGRIAPIAGLLLAYVPLAVLAWFLGGGKADSR